MEQNNNKLNRNLQIDGLRGLAISLIVIYHLICRFGQLYLKLDNHILHHWGSFGTSIFLLITCFYLGKYAFQKSDFSYCKYVKSKMARLWPTYAICIILIFIVLYFWELPGRTSEFKDLFLNICMVNGYVGAPYIDGSHWYLTTILSLSLIVGFFRTINISQQWWAYVVWMAFGILAKYFKITVVSKMLGNSFIGYATIGIILFYVTFEHKRLTKGWIISLLIAIIYIFFVSGGVYGVELFFVVPLFCAVQNNKLKWLECKFFINLGTISYSIYLIHQNIGLTIEYHMMKKYGTYSYGYAVIALVCVTFIGLVIYNLVEKKV